jgi:pimeloyl-ACP methyl ester carboxylesterase
MAYVRTRLGRWFFEERGNPKGPAVVLAHGLLFDRTMWNGQIEALTKLGARVITVDHPGHGNSEVPPPFSLDDHARAVVDALDGWNIERPVFVGLSWGGMLGMRLAISNAARVRAIVLADTTAGAEPRSNRIKYRALASFEKHFGLPDSLARSQIAPLLFSADALKNRPELYARWEKRLVGFSRLGIYRAAKAVVIDRQEIASKLGQITTPTLVICGSEDLAQPPIESEKIAAGIKHSKLEVIRGVGHMSAIEDPQAFNALLVPFVSAHLS